MLSKEMNEMLTRVGAGTPVGELMRRYWHPIAATVELDENPVKKVRLLGEDLVLYRDRSGNLGLIDEPCPHRRVSLEYGIPEEEGLRCPYHGWLFNHEGKCTEQPAEPWNSTFKDRVTTKAYKAQELSGLVFAYVGPDPAPLLPRFDLFMWDDSIRQIGVTVLPCNWLQAMENSLDPLHVEWLHGYYMDYVLEREGRAKQEQFLRRHKKIGFDRFEFGIIKRRLVEGNTEEDHPWAVGHPIIFPTILRVGSGGSYNFQYRVPMDDTHTYHVSFTAFRPGIPLPPQESIPLYEIPFKNADGKYNVDVVLVQDFFAWDSQGPIAARDKERLGQTDIGVIMLREIVKEQAEKVARGEDPMGTVRDPAKNVCIELPQEEATYDARLKRGRAFFVGAPLELAEHQYSPLSKHIESLFMEADARAARGEDLLPERVPPHYAPGGPGHRQVQLLPE